jgi:formate C-acetyltransferase
MRTLLIDDCIDKGLDFYNGGARYSWSIVNFAGLINIIDSLAVIKDFIYDKKIYTPEKMLTLLKENNEAFLNEARNFKYSYGNGSSDTNNLAKAVSKDIFSMLDNKKLHLGLGFLPASIQFMTQAMAGKYIHATPDGRCDASPLCDSLAAIFGKDDKGPTALLKSVTSLDLEHALGIPVVNFNISESFKDETLEALIRGYMALGGVHMQVSCASRETLLDAYEHPELHNNLVVRVGGYSEYFNRLSDDLKKMIINRSIH